MKLANVALFFKGMAMGTVDIVPGVSGSTVAVLLGIYERFIAALKNINLTLIKAIVRPFRHKLSAESREECRKTCQEADLPWLINLMLGLFAAFIVASLVIPALMERFPQIMRGIFFGLVLGSIITPIRSIKTWKISRILIILLFGAGFYLMLGMQVSAPVALESVVVEQGQSLESICLEAPCFNSPGEVLAIPENAQLRGVISGPGDIIPAGMEIWIQKPLFWYCLLAGFSAICAMLLPGISGSFILLVLGSYYFMLNTGKGFMAGLAHGTFYGTHLLYLSCFVLGAVTGIAVFSRVLTWLFKQHREMTLAAIIGILLGCLRAVWPYKQMDAHGIQINIIPDMGDSLFLPTIAAVLCGLGVVAATVIIQTRIERKEQKLSAESE